MAGITGVDSVAQCLRNQSGGCFHQKIMVVLRPHPAIPARRCGQPVLAVIVDVIPRLQIDHGRVHAAAVTMLDLTEMASIIVASVVVASIIVTSIVITAVVVMVAAIAVTGTVAIVFVVLVLALVVVARHGRSGGKQQHGDGGGEQQTFHERTPCGWFGPRLGALA